MNRRFRGRGELNRAAVTNSGITNIVLSGYRNPIKILWLAHSQLFLGVSEVSRAKFPMFIGVHIEGLDTDLNTMGFSSARFPSILNQ